MDGPDGHHGGFAGTCLAILAFAWRRRLPFWSVIVAGIVGMFIGDWVAGLLGVQETFGYDWIRHGIQVVAGVIMVALAAKVFTRKPSDLPQ